MVGALAWFGFVALLAYVADRFGGPGEFPWPRS